MMELGNVRGETRKFHAIRVPMTSVVMQRGRVMKHKIEIAPNKAIYIDGERTIGSKPYGLFLTTTMIVSDDDLKRLADRCLAVIADRKTENSSEKPNNSKERSE
jgi:hypothetical protein